MMPVYRALHDHAEGGPTLTLSLDERSHGASEHGMVQHLRLRGDETVSGRDGGRHDS